MPTRYPPRREPRVLAVAKTPLGLLFAVVDPWEIRGTGTIACTRRSASLMFRRLLRREKPTALVADGTSLALNAKRAARGARLPLVATPRRLPPAFVATDLYPELLLFAPNRALLRIARIAIAAVLHSPVTPRRYATSRRDRPAPRAA